MDGQCPLGPPAVLLGDFHKTLEGLPASVALARLGWGGKVWSRIVDMFVAWVRSLLGAALGSIRGRSGRGGRSGVHLRPKRATLATMGLHGQADQAAQLTLELNTAPMHALHDTSHSPPRPLPTTRGGNVVPPRAPHAAGYFGSAPNSMQAPLNS